MRPLRPCLFFSASKLRLLTLSDPSEYHLFQEAFPETPGRIYYSLLCSFISCLHLSYSTDQTKQYHLITCPPLPPMPVPQDHELFIIVLNVIVIIIIAANPY